MSFFNKNTDDKYFEKYKLKKIMQYSQSKNLSTMPTFAELYSINNIKKAILSIGYLAEILEPKNETAKLGRVDIIDNFGNNKILFSFT